MYHVTEAPGVAHAAGVGADVHPHLGQGHGPGGAAEPADDWFAVVADEGCDVAALAAERGAAAGPLRLLKSAF